MNTYKIEYTSFKGTPYACSGITANFEAKDITSLLKKIKSTLGLDESAINKIIKL